MCALALLCMSLFNGVHGGVHTGRQGKCAPGLPRVPIDLAPLQAIGQLPFETIQPLWL